MVLQYEEMTYHPRSRMISFKMPGGVVFESKDFGHLMTDLFDWQMVHDLENPAPEPKQEKKKVDKMRIIQMIVSFVGIAAIIVFALCSVGV